MSKEKQARREQIGGPANNPQAMAKSMAVIPGGPPNTQLNSPQNVTSQMGPGGGYVNPYGDGGIADERTHGDVYPAPNSGIPQFSGIFSDPNQPDIRMEEQIEAMRLNNPIMTSPMAQPSMMGIIGMTAQGAPGSFPPQMPSGGPGFMPTTDQYMMTPGATPRVEGKGKPKEDRVA